MRAAGEEFGSELGEAEKRVPEGRNKVYEDKAGDGVVGRYGRTEIPQRSAEGEAGKGVIKLLKMGGQYQLRWERSSGILLKPQPGFVPLGLHLVKVKSCILWFSVKRTWLLYMLRKSLSCSFFMIGVESFIQLLPVRFELPKYDALSAVGAPVT